MQPAPQSAIKRLGHDFHLNLEIEPKNRFFQKRPRIERFGRQRPQARRLTIGDLELGGLAELLNVALLVELVGLLVVDEEVGGAGATGPLVVQSLVLRFLKGLLNYEIQILASVTRWSAPANRIPAAVQLKLLKSPERAVYLQLDTLVA